MENSEYVVLSRKSYDELKAEIGELQVDLQIANDKLEEFETKYQTLTELHPVFKAIDEVRVKMPAR